MSKKVKNYHCLIYTFYKIVQETVDTFLNNGICLHFSLPYYLKLIKKIKLEDEIRV